MRWRERGRLLIGSCGGLVIYGDFSTCHVDRRQWSCRPFEYSFASAKWCEVREQRLSGGCVGFRNFVSCFYEVKIREVHEHSYIYS